MATMAGGVGSEKPADAAIQEIADKVKSSVEEQSGRKFTVFQAISYASQVVAGINYFIKVDVGEGDFITIRVFQNLDQEVSLSGYQLDKKKDDPIQYF